MSPQADSGPGFKGTVQRDFNSVFLTYMDRLGLSKNQRWAKLLLKVTAMNFFKKVTAMKR
jgi:hypothetical protein